MPDRRKHRGKHPQDDRLFAESWHEALRTSVAEYSWLLTRSYAPDSALKLVGDRHRLTARQRLALMRSACSDPSLRGRASRRTTLDQCRGGSLGIDGYNLLITIESALSGGLILIGRDGCCRDLAGIHGTYRKVEETQGAIELIANHLAAATNRTGGACGLSRIDWYLDRPVSNSGRLKAFMADLLEAMSLQSAPPSVEEPTRPTWNIELVDSPDAVLRAYKLEAHVDPSPIVTADSAVLDRCGLWVNLASEIIRAHIPDAWIVDLRTP